MGLLSNCKAVFGRLGSTVQCEQLSPRQLGIRALLHLRGIHGDQRGKNSQVSTFPLGICEIKVLLGHPDQ